MNIQGFTRAQLEDTIRQCNAALHSVSVHERIDRQNQAQKVKDAIFKAALVKFPDPLGAQNDDLLEHLDQEMKKQDLWIRVNADNDGSVQCSHDDCWYDNNEDRIEEYKRSYHAVFRDEYIIHCDVRCDNVEEEGYVLDEIYDAFLEWFNPRKRLKKQAK